MKRTKILVSNDDGIDSRGIAALVSALQEIGDVTVVAPLREQSAVGHAITVKAPLRVTRYSKGDKFFGYAVDGTPADCVKMAIRILMDERPDIVVSGINNGLNTATNVIYSGTVSAAREAAILDVPAVAVSIGSRNAQHLETASYYAKEMVLFALKHRLQPFTLLNINVPDRAMPEIAGVKVTSQGKSRWDDSYDKRKDPSGVDYYWLTGGMLVTDTTLQTDHIAVQHGYVSVTPLSFDLTDYSVLDKLIEWKADEIR